MNEKIGIVVRAVLASTIAAVAAAQTPPVDVTAQSDSCFNQTGTIPLTCDMQCVSSQPCENYQVSVCSNAEIDEGIPGSANTLPGGTFQKTTCTEPTMPFGGTFTATGTWTGTNSVFFACVPSSLTGSTASFLISASDKTGQAATTTLTVPVCGVSGPSFTVHKSLGTQGFVNGHTRVGDIIEFDITVSNVGTAPGSFTLTDEASPGLSPFSVNSGGPPCDLTTSYIDCHFLSPGLSAGSTYTVKMFFKVTKVGDLTNTAYIAQQVRVTSNPVTVDARPPRPQVTRQGSPPLRDLTGHIAGTRG